MYELRNNGDVYIKPSAGQPKLVGEINDGYFLVEDKDNYHYATRSLGIDECILYAKDLKYSYITARFHGYNYTTTRIYFADHHTRRSLLNFRTMVFMPLDEWSITRALKYERDLRDKNDLKNMDIFDVLAKDNQRLLNMWLELNNSVKEIKPKKESSQSKFIRRIEL